MSAALARYRVMAYVVGVWLIVLVFVGMPLKYLADEPLVVRIVGPVHGFLYIVYLVFALDLAIKRRYALPRTALMLLAGVLPFLAFWVERRVTRDVRAAIS
jgi:integral membrane protein